MTRDLRLHLWIVVLPVIFVTIGGLRLLYVEAVRSRTAEENSLQAMAESATKSFSRQILDQVDFLLDRVPSLSDDASYHAFAAEYAPLVSTAFRWIKGEGLVCPSSRCVIQPDAASYRRLAVPLGPDAAWSIVRAPRDYRGRFERGWRFIPWDADASILAWVRVSSNEVRGVEIARETLRKLFLEHIDALGVNNPDSSTPHATVACIRDFVGREVLSPSAPIRGEMCGRALLGRMLPDWTLYVYWRDGDWALAGERSSTICLGVCLLVLLVSSLVGGATLLIRSALAARRDALRKTNFVSTVTHELKTPLTTIRLCADLLESGAMTDEAGLRRAAHSIVVESDRLSRIVTNVLTLGRLDLKRQQLSPEDLPLAPLIRDIAATIPDFTFNLSVPEDVSVSVEALSLQGILFNLFENAVKYAKEGGPVDIVLEGISRDEVRLLVMDRGPGMTKDEMAHAFDQFWRADNSVVRETGGVGLGLSIARGLARRMGGDLTVARREGGGCVFTLTLPAAKSGGEGGANG